MAEEKKAALRNFTFTQAADKQLVEQSAETGKTMTAVLEDHLLGRRQFKPQLEKFLEDEALRTRRTRKEIIESAIDHYASREKLSVLELNDKINSSKAGQLAVKHLVRIRQRVKSGVRRRRVASDASLPPKV